MANTKDLSLQLFPCPLHCHLPFLAQRGGVLVRNPHATSNLPRQLLQRRGADCKNEQFKAAYNMAKSPFNWTVSAYSILMRLQLT